jgi:hypothetical protein
MMMYWNGWSAKVRIVLVGLNVYQHIVLDNKAISLVISGAFLRRERYLYNNIIVNTLLDSISFSSISFADSSASTGGSESATPSSSLSASPDTVFERTSSGRSMALPADARDSFASSTHAARSKSSSVAAVSRFSSAILSLATKT